MKIKEVTLTAAEIKAIERQLSMMVKTKFQDSRFPLKLYRILKALSIELDPINKTVADLIGQYVKKDDKGNPMREENNTRFIYATPEDEAAHEAAFRQVHNTEIIVQVPCFTEDEVCKNMANASMEDMSILDQFIGDNNE